MSRPRIRAHLRLGAAQEVARRRSRSARSPPSPAAAAASPRAPSSTCPTRSRRSPRGPRPARAAIDTSRRIGQAVDGDRERPRCARRLTRPRAPRGRGRPHPPPPPSRRGSGSSRRPPRPPRRRGRRGGALDRAGTDGRQVHAPVLPGLRRLEEHAARARRAGPAAAVRATKSSMASVPWIDSSPRQMPPATTAAWPTSAAPSAATMCRRARRRRAGRPRTGRGPGQHARRRDEVGQDLVRRAHREALPPRRSPATMRRVESSPAAQPAEHPRRQPQHREVEAERPELRPDDAAGEGHHAASRRAQVGEEPARLLESARGAPGAPSSQSSATPSKTTTR